MSQQLLYLLKVKCNFIYCSVKDGLIRFMVLLQNSYCLYFFINISSVCLVCFFTELLTIYFYPLLQFVLTNLHLVYFFTWAWVCEISVGLLLFVILCRSLTITFFSTFTCSHLLILSFFILFLLFRFFGFWIIKKTFCSALILLGLSSIYYFLDDFASVLMAMCIILSLTHFRFTTLNLVLFFSTTLFAYDLSLMLNHYLFFPSNSFFFVPFSEVVLSPEESFFCNYMFSVGVKIAKSIGDKTLAAAASQGVQQAEYSILTMKPEYQEELRGIHREANTGIEVHKLAETHPLYVKTEDFEAMNEKQEGSVIVHVLSSDPIVKEIRDDNLTVIEEDKEAVYCVSDGTKDKESHFTGQSMELSYEESKKYFEEKPKHKKFDNIFQSKLEEGAKIMMEKHKSEDPSVCMSDFTERRTTHLNFKKKNDGN